SETQFHAMPLPAAHHQKSVNKVLAQLVNNVLALCPPAVPPGASPGAPASSGRSFEPEEWLPRSERAAAALQAEAPVLPLFECIVRAPGGCCLRFEDSPGD